MLLCFDPTHCLKLGLVFGWETEGIWTRVLHRSCGCICELDVRLVNHSNCVKPRKNSIFLKRGKMVIFRYSIDGKSENFLDLE